MKPFRSDHQLYHVKEEIIEWLKNQPFHVLLNFISGQSIKYLRSNQPVLVFSPPDEHYFNLLNYFKKNLQNNAKFYEYKNSFKVIFDYANENSLHFIIQRHFVYPHVLISVDRLYYDYKNRRWKGNREDLLDYQKGLIRIIKPEQLNIKQIFNLIVYCSQMDFILEKETQNKIKKIFPKKNSIH
jgi:hypothetical protein